MNLKKFITTAILSLGLLKAVSGSSYSNVYVEREISPVRYYRYGTPYSHAQITSPQIAEFTSLPASLSRIVAPCVSPCILPEQTVPGIGPSPTVLQYNSQPYATVPVVIAPAAKDEAAGYEYSYAVYDDSTGDHKMQRELGDGSAVRGEYSFLQPNGYVREVKYVADDVKGFNAVVKNFLPITLESKRQYGVNARQDIGSPCPEALKEAIDPELIEHSDIPANDQETINENYLEVKFAHKNDSGGQAHEYKNESYPKSKANLEIPNSDEPKEFSVEIKENSVKHSTDELSQASKADSKENHDKSKTEPKESLEIIEILSNKPEKQSSAESEEAFIKDFDDLTNGEDQVQESHEKQASQNELGVIVPSMDIIHCIEAALRRANENAIALRDELSPLTYILLKKPC